MQQRELLKAQGVENLPMTPEEVRQMIKEQSERKNAQLVEARDKINAKIETGTTTLAPNFTAADVDFLATTRVKLSQKDILKMYVGNWASLDLKQRRKVMGYVQAQRSKHAKEIFLKELSALGRKMNQSSAEATIADSRVVGKKDPMKLKLEQITM